MFQVSVTITIGAQGCLYGRLHHRAAARIQTRCPLRGSLQIDSICRHDIGKQRRRGIIERQQVKPVLRSKPLQRLLQAGPGLNDRCPIHGARGINHHDHVTWQRPDGMVALRRYDHQHDIVGTVQLLSEDGGPWRCTHYRRPGQDKVAIHRNRAINQTDVVLRVMSHDPDLVIGTGNFPQFHADVKLRRDHHRIDHPTIRRLHVG